MRKMKKFMSLLLAVVMTLSVMAVNVFAAAGSITIKNSVEGEEYSIYKLFDMTLSGASYSYKVTAEWEEFFTDGEGAAYVDLDENGYITNASASTDAAAIAKLAGKELDGKTAVETVEGDGSDIVIGGLELGYYLVTSTLGTSGTCMLNNTDPDVDVEDKNIIPRIAKGVDEDSTDALIFGAYNHAEIGQVMDFQIVLHSEAAPNDYELTDELPAGMVLVENSVVVYKYDKTKVIPAEPEADALFTAYGIEEGTDGFAIDFTDGNENIKKEDQIVVRYQAKLTEGAAISTPNKISANVNTATLSYEDDSLTAETNTYTFAIPVYKFYKDANGDKVDLPGAEFKLQNEGGEWAVVDTATGILTGWVADEEDGTPLTSDSKGELAFAGLDDDEYSLKETAAPDGFNQLSSAITVKFTITAGNTTIDAYEVNDADQIKVENKTGVNLPSTGGIGTVIFRVGGVALIVLAGALLIVKKRSNNI